MTIFLFRNVDILIRGSQKQYFLFCDEMIAIYNFMMDVGSQISDMIYDGMMVFVTVKGLPHETVSAFKERGP